MRKNACILFISLCIFTFAKAQNTWVQKLNYIYGGPYNYSDSLTGVKYLDIGRDGDIFAIANFGLSTSSKLFKISSLGAPIKWTIPVGYHPGNSATYTNSVHATSDSGCIITYNFKGQFGNIDGIIQKYSKDGELTWEHPFNSNYPYYSNETFDVIENVAGNYFALAGDTVYELNVTGNILRYDSTINGRKIIELKNGNILIQTLAGDVICRTFGGPDLWSISSARLLTCNSKYAFVVTAAGVQKADLQNGNITWTKSYPWMVTDADTTSDGGITVCSGYIPGNTYSNCTNCHGPGIIFKVDSLGDTLWSKSYNLPYYGFGKIKRTSIGNLITGGAFKFIITYYNNNRDFSSFLTSLDSSGNGILGTTDYIWPGNSNNNQTIGLSDDALYVVLEFGKSGPSRDTINFLNNSYPCCKSDYASDWLDTSVLGINLKYSDFNGDGVIDTNDILKYTDNTIVYPLALPAYRFASPTSNIQSIASLYITPESDTINSGDTLRYFIIAGDSTDPIDSLCGIAFTGMWPWYSHIANGSSIIEMNSDLGIIGSDLYSLGRINNASGNFDSFFLNCRTNGQDAYQINDTLGMFLLILDSLSTIDSVNFAVFSSNAIKCNGETIPLNVVTRAVTINPGTVGINSKQRNPLYVYPNPASDLMYISFSKINVLNSEIKIYNATGNLMLTKITSEKNIQLPIRELSNGIYFLSIQNSEGVFHKSFAVQH
jgi:hypothetical protein